MFFSLFPLQTLIIQHPAHLANKEEEGEGEEGEEEEEEVLEGW